MVLQHYLNVLAQLAGAVFSVLAFALSAGEPVRAACPADVRAVCSEQEGQMSTQGVRNAAGHEPKAGPDDGLEPRFVSLPTGVRLEYVERGPSDGVPVIFLHGVTDSWRSFGPLLRRLPASIRAFAISQRGHGESSKPEAGYRYTDFSEDVRAFMDAMALPRAVVVGHSMGASVAQRFIVDHPGRVQRLVLMGSFATIHGNATVAEFVDSAIRPLTDPISPDFAREWQMSTVAQPVDERFFDTVVQETLKVPARVWHQAFEGFLQTPDFTRELRSVSVPVLLFWGDRDAYAVRADQDALLKAMPTARLVAYEGVGHAIHWEEPQRVADTLVAFIGDTR
jgi:pimeloyl-ACP methyl ester carboxylesterase